MKISNLAGAFTGEGFAKKRGRLPSSDGIGWIPGPIDLNIRDADGSIDSIAPASKEAGDFDGSGCVVTCGWIDSHTHAWFGGSRASEFFLRWSGESYQGIAAKGGGIHRTVEATVSETEAAMGVAFVKRLQTMLADGFTTVEVKSGYGSNAQEELEILRRIKRCSLPDRKDRPRVFSTYLGLHALPKGQSEHEFVNEQISILPTIQQEGLANYIDAFPEQGFFSLEESLRFVGAGLERGLKAKVHADEITNMNAAESFSQIGALSVDHLQRISTKGVLSLCETPTVATLLPATSLFLGIDYAPARRLLNAGARVALATDFNPGTAPTSSRALTCLLAASQFKMNAAEIFCAFTYNAAQAMGLGETSGCLLPGKIADLCLWKISQKNASPLSLLEELVLSDAKPELLFVDGRVARV